MNPINRQTIIHSLNASADTVFEMIASCPRDILKDKPAGRGWSIHEHACHLAAVQPLMRERLETVLASHDPYIKGYQPNRDEAPNTLIKMDLDMALLLFREERERIVLILKNLSEEQWAKPVVHEEYERYSIAIMCRHLSMHDYLHGYRIESILLGEKL